MNKTCPYRPLGTRVIVQILPMQTDNKILLPGGETNISTPQTYEVIGVGGAVNDDKFSLNVGEIVLLSCHPSEVFPLNKEDKLIMVDRSKIVAAMKAETQN
jgi:co-chaperonin GroES (HSP10)